MTNINLLLSDELLAEVDRARGDVPRVRWIRRAIEVALGRVESERKAQAAAKVIVAEPEHYGPSVVQTARRAVHAATCKCPVCS